MRSSRCLMLLAGLVAASGITPNAHALDELPRYEAVDLGQMVREVYPTAGVASAIALNEAGHAVGFANVGGDYLATIYTEAHGVHFLPGLADYTSHEAVGVSNPDAAGVVRIAGNALESIGSEPGRAVLWLYDTIAGAVVKTIDIGVLPGYSTGSLAGVNDQGLAIGRSVGGDRPPFSRAMVFDETYGTLTPLDLPFAPVAINNANQTAGGTYRAQLGTPFPGEWEVVLPVEDLGLPPDTWGGTIYALNDEGDVAGYSIRTYTDGMGRYVKAATRFRDVDAWSILWSNSAFDYGLGLNKSGDTVGTLGIWSATRGALYIEALNQTFLIEDLLDPPGAVDTGYDINDAGWIAGGSVLYKHVGAMPPPTAPVDLIATPHEPTWQQPWNAIGLSWANTSTRTWDYQVERRVAGTATWVVIRNSWSATSMWDTGVALGTTYEYRVRARGVAGFSDYSNLATATSPSDPVDTSPPTVAVTAPAAGAEVSGSVTVAAQASDNVGVASLSITYSGPSGSARICTISGATSLSCNWNTKRLTAGVYSLTATAADAMNNGDSASITVQVVAGGKGGKGGGGGGGGGRCHPKKGC